MLPPNIFTTEPLIRAVEKLRQENKTIVMTNGCFDILHYGHIMSLTYAKEKGDILIVAVNDDASVQRLKGAARPVFPLELRMKTLCALRAVDAVTSFSQDNAADLVRVLRPDVYVKSEEYDLPNTPEGLEVLKYGGKLISAPRLPGISTTAIIEKSCLDGGRRT